MEACHKLDLEVAQKTGSIDHQGGASFESYVSALNELSLLKEQREREEQAATVLEQISTLLALTLPQGSSALGKRPESRDLLFKQRYNQNLFIKKTV